MPTQQAVSLNASRILNTVGTPPKQQWNGIYMASVVQNNDPLGEGRVTLYIPQVLGTAVSNWARPLGYTPTDVPAISTMVHAYFAGGDVNHPIYASINFSTQFNGINSDITTINSTLTNLQNQVNNIQPGAWSACTVGSGWSNSGGALIPLQIRSILPGVGQLAGVLTFGSPGSLSNGTLVGTLPSAFTQATYAQVLPVTVTGVSVADAFVGVVTGTTDNNGLSDPTTGGQSGIVVGGNAGSNSHEHFPGTYVVNNAQHQHTNLSAGQNATINMDLSNPFLELDTSGNITIWNMSANTSQITINTTIVT